MGDVRIEQYMLKSFELNDTFKNLIAIRINDVISELMGDLLIALGENCKNLKRAEFSGNFVLWLYIIHILYYP